MKIHKITQTYRSRKILAVFISVARVRPRTSKGITDLLLPQTSNHFLRLVPLRSYYEPEFAQLFSRLRSRSLSQLSRQITPPTKNGHAAYLSSPLNMHDFACAQDQTRQAPRANARCLLSADVQEKERFMFTN
jgi:hypothetical protein